MDELFKNGVRDRDEAAEKIDYTNYFRGSQPDSEAEMKALIDQETAYEIQDQRDIIANNARLLKESRTLVNSKEYCELMDLMEKVGAGKTNPIPGRNAREQFAQELYMLHEYTEKYLKHKARDGVKKNAYRKLLAVERANRAVLVAAGRMGHVTVSTGVSGQTMDLADVPFRLADRVKGRPEEYAAKPLRYYDERAREVRDNNQSLKNNVSKAAVADCIRSVDECMGKIMLKAEELGDPTAVQTLSAMRQSFLDDPFPVVQENAPKIEAANKVL